MEELKIYYKELEKIILSISKNDWEQIVVRFVSDEIRNGLNIFYKQDYKYVTINEYIDKGIIDKSAYMLAVLNMSGIASKIRKLDAEKKQGLWKTMVLILKKDEESTIRYTYEDLIDDMFAEEIIWRYKYLNIVPNEANMKYIEGVEQKLL